MLVVDFLFTFLNLGVALFFPFWAFLSLLDAVDVALFDGGCCVLFFEAVATRGDERVVTIVDDDVGVAASFNG